MSNQIVSFKSDAGIEVTLVPDKIRELICPQADNHEIALFIAHCQAHRLDPFTKEAYLIKYDQNRAASIVTNYNVFNARAQEHEDYIGIEDGVVVLTKDGEIVHRQGSAVYASDLGERLLGGWARVKREGKGDTYVELALSDYSTGRSKWKTSPGLMINKCAKSAAWRTAYPREFDGMYSREEMDQAIDGVAPEPVRVEATVERAPKVDDLTPVRARFRAFTEATGLDKDAANAALCAKAGVSKLSDATPAQIADLCAWMDAQGPEYEAVPADDAPGDDGLSEFIHEYDPHRMAQAGEEDVF